MEQMHFCQSCGMPLLGEQDKGTEAGGARSEDYCTYCYQDGAFTQTCTMEEMIDFCAKFEAEQGRAASAEEAKAQMRQWLPTLKRWRHQDA